MGIKLIRRSQKTTKKRRIKVPLLPWRKLGRLEKIRGTIELQKICSSFGIPFEPIRVYRAGKKVNLEDLAGAERIIVRTPVDRREYLIKHASQPRLQDIAGEIESFGRSQARKFIVQQVGLRESIESYGTIEINTSSRSGPTIHYLEKPYTKAEKNAADAFLAESANATGTILKAAGNKLSPDGKKFINDKIGKSNAHEMVEYVLNRAKKNKTLWLMFVSYRGKKPCFYKMLAS